jgi:hypothetical protein
MKIKVVNSDLNKNTLESINNLMDMDINVSSAFKLMKIVKELSPLVETKGEMEKKIMDKYAEKDENGQYIQPVDQEGNVIEGSVNIKDFDSFTKEMKDLMEIENELQFDKVNIDDLGLKTVKTKDLISLEFLFEMS